MILGQDMKTKPLFPSHMPYRIDTQQTLNGHTGYFTDTRWSLNRQWMDTCQTLGGNLTQDGHSIDTGWTLGGQRIDTGETRNRH